MIWQVMQKAYALTVDPYVSKMNVQCSDAYTQASIDADAALHLLSGSNRHAPYKLEEARLLLSPCLHTILG